MNIARAYRELKLKSPTSRKEREKWGTQHPAFWAEEANFLGRLVEFRSGPFDYVVKAGQPARQKVFPRVIRYAKNLQIACRFPATPFD